MAVTRRRHTGSVATLLAIIICMAVCTDMATAWWANVCTRGDTYVERYERRATDCSGCTNWCNSMCSTVGGITVKDVCQPDSGDHDCMCCCSKPPTSPSLPPTPSSAAEFSAGDLNSICTSEQTYLMITHTQGSDCALKPQCENKCKGKGAFVSAGSQCIGNGDDEEKSYTWIEQCCCNEAPPAPPPCPSSCGSEINIQISVTSGGCGAKSPTPSTCVSLQ